MEQLTKADLVWFRHYCTDYLRKIRVNSCVLFGVVSPRLITRNSTASTNSPRFDKKYAFWKSRFLSCQAC